MSMFVQLCTDMPNGPRRFLLPHLLPRHAKGRHGAGKFIVKHLIKMVDAEGFEPTTR
jgi:hypothetical protein